MLKKIVGGVIGKIGAVFSVELQLVDIHTGRVERVFSEETADAPEQLLASMRRASYAFCSIDFASEPKEGQQPQSEAVSNMQVRGAKTGSGLVAHYDLDGDARDEAGGYNGIMHGPTPSTNRFGKARRALRFDGVDDFVEVPRDVSLFPTEQLTVSAWVRADCWGPLEHSNSIVDCEVPGSRAGYGLRGGANTAGFFVSNGSWQVVRSGPGAIVPGDWIHIAGRYDGYSLK